MALKAARVLKPQRSAILSERSRVTLSRCFAAASFTSSSSSRTVRREALRNAISSVRGDTPTASATSRAVMPSSACLRITSIARATRTRLPAVLLVESRSTIPERPYVTRTIGRRAASLEPMKRSSSLAALYPHASKSKAMLVSVGDVFSQIEGLLSTPMTAICCGTDILRLRQTPITDCATVSDVARIAHGFGRAVSQLPRPLRSA